MQDAPEAPLAPNQTTDCCLAIHNTVAFHPFGLGPESDPGFSDPPWQKQTFPKTSVGSLPTPNAQLRGASLPCLSGPERCTPPFQALLAAAESYRFHH